MVGRLKDMLIMRGRNYYAHDIEASIEAACGAIRPGCCAVVGIELSAPIDSEADGGSSGAASEEGVAIIAEVRDADMSEAAAVELARAVRTATANAHGVPATAVVLLLPRTILKTTSGKLRRAACRAALETLVADAAAAAVPGAVPTGAGPKSEIAAADVLHVWRAGGLRDGLSPLPPTEVAAARQFLGAFRLSAVRALPETRAREAALCDLLRAAVAVALEVRIEDETISLAELCLTSVEAAQTVQGAAAALSGGGGASKGEGEGGAEDGAGGSSSQLLGPIDLLGASHSLATLSALMAERLVTSDARAAAARAEAEAEAERVEGGAGGARPLPMWAYRTLELCGVAVLVLLPAVPRAFTFGGLGALCSALDAPLMFLALLPPTYIASLALQALMSIGLKWLVLGRVTAGAHPLFGLYALRWWFAHSAIHSNDTFVSSVLGLGTSAHAWWLRALGARIGRGARVETLKVSGHDLLDVGEGAHFGGRLLTVHEPYPPRHGRPALLRLGAVSLGDGAVVGPMALVLRGARVGVRAVVGPASCVRGTTLPPGTHWSGASLRQVDTDPCEGLVYESAAGLYAKAAARAKPTAGAGGEQTLLPPRSKLGLPPKPRCIERAAAALIRRLAPALTLYLIFALMYTLAAFLLYVPREPFAAWRYALLGLAVWAIVLVVQPLGLLVMLLLKWGVVGRLVPGRVYRTDGWKMAARAMLRMYTSSFTSNFCFGTASVLAPNEATRAFYRLMGASFGTRSILLDPKMRHASEHFAIGDDAFLNMNNESTLAETRLTGAGTDERCTRLRPLQLGNGALVGHGAVVHEMGDHAAALHGACSAEPVPPGVVVHGAPPSSTQWQLDVGALRRRLASVRPSRSCYACTNAYVYVIALAIIPLLLLASCIAAWELTMSPAMKWSQQLAVGACNTPAFANVAALPPSDVRAAVRGAYLQQGCDKHELPTRAAHTRCAATAAALAANALTPRIDPGLRDPPAHGLYSVCRVRACETFDAPVPLNTLPNCWEDELPTLPNCSNAARVALAMLDFEAIEAALLDSTGSGGTMQQREIAICTDALLDACRRDEISTVLMLPTGGYPPRAGTPVAPAACAREAVMQILVANSWRRPHLLLENWVRLQLFGLVLWVVMILLMLILFRLLGGRYVVRETRTFDVRDREPFYAFNRPSSIPLPFGIMGSQLGVDLMRAEGVTIGRRVFVDRDAVIFDGELVRIGDDAVICSQAAVLGHDLAGAGSHVMLRGRSVVPAACRVGESARIGAGTLVQSAEVPPLYSTVPNQSA